MSFYITTPIYYVNGEPHHGHAYTTVAADVLARHHRQRGEDVFFLTGTDEHGTKVAQAAEERGLTPQQHVDQLAPRYRELAAALGASNDFFIRTTDPEHEAFVQGFVEKLKAAGDIEKRSYGGLYCTACEAFWYERDLTADGLCPDHGIKPVWLEEENYYFLLSRYQDRLAEFFRANPAFVKPKSRYNEALSFIEQGLEDISISRSSITWGVSVPWDDEQVIYVWVDALINYLSALTYARPGEDLTARYWPAFHFLAKDILKFHAVIWPALLMSAGYDLPTGELIHGYLLVGGEKMSKTRGNVLDPFAVIQDVGAEPLRYYLMREVTLGQDGDVSLEGLRARYNNELANELGNLVSRTVSMIGKYRDGAIPQAGPEGEALAAVAAEGEAMVAKAGGAVRRPRRDGCARLRVGVRAAPQPAGGRRGAVEARQGRGAGGPPGRRAQRAGGGAAPGRAGRVSGDPRHGRRGAAPHRAGARRRRPAPGEGDLGGAHAGHGGRRAVAVPAARELRRRRDRTVRPGAAHPR